MDAGLVDAFRERFPDLTGYTYWSRRFPHLRQQNRGWRLDYFLVGTLLMGWGPIVDWAAHGFHCIALLRELCGGRVADSLCCLPSPTQTTILPPHLPYAGVKVVLAAGLRCLPQIRLCRIGSLPFGAHPVSGPVAGGAGLVMCGSQSNQSATAVCSLALF